MVGKQTGRIARGMMGAALAALACAVPASAQLGGAAASPPDAQKQCPAKPSIEGDYNNRDKPLALPEAWSAFASSSMNWIAVATELGTVHCVDTTWFIASEKYDQFDERLLGIAWQGYEAWGYVLIDTAGVGSSMEIGTRPVFSPSNSLFAVVQWTETGWGGFEGFAVWRNYPGGISPVRVETNVPFLADWRIDRWEGEDCLHLSAIPHERVTDWDDLSKYERDRYVAGAAGGWALTPGDTCPSY